MTTWEVWTDGSCKCVGDGSRGDTPKGGVGFGGWAAIVEHGSDGFVLRGRESETTNVEMELRAMIEGLREVADGERVILHTDSTVALAVRERWQREDRLPHRPGVHRNGRPIHWKLWLELMAEYDRVDVEVRLIGKGPNAVHSRAHAYAGAEAKAGAGNLPRHLVPLDEADRRILGERFRRDVRAWRDRQNQTTARPLPSSTS